MKKKAVLNIIGIFFLVLGIAAILNAIHIKDYSGVLWFCYFGLILIGISILKRNSYLLTAQLNILTIPLLFWTIDFFYALFNTQSLFGIVDYFFLRDGIIGKIISSQHVFTLPLSFYALHLLKLKKDKSWKLSFLEITILYFVTLLLTQEASNINCVYRSCNNFIPNEFYTFNWFVPAFSMIILTNIAIKKIFLKRGK